MSGVRSFFRKLFAAPVHAGCKLTIDAADRIEAASKRIESAADEFGSMAKDMRGKRKKTSTAKKKGPKPKC